MNWAVVQTCMGRAKAAEILTEPASEGGQARVMVEGAQLSIWLRPIARYASRQDAKAAVERVMDVKRRYAAQMAFSDAHVTRVEEERAKAIREALAA